MKKDAELMTLENRRKDSLSILIENILLAFAKYEKETIIWIINKAFENKNLKGKLLEASGQNMDDFFMKMELKK